MSESSSKFWTFVGLPASLLLLSSAYYIKVPAARTWIDARTSLGKQLLGRYVPDAPPADGTDATGNSDGSNTPGGPGSGDGSASGNPPISDPGPSKPITYDLQTLARDHSLWPRQVRLRKPTKFPAVVDGKEVGSLVAPTGTEVNLLAIREGKLGLEYKGGGAWLAVEDTDLANRVPLR